MERQESDLELMLRVRGHDGDAMAELMRRYRGSLVPFFSRLSRDADLAEDLFQETFIRLWSAGAVPADGEVLDLSPADCEEPVADGTAPLAAAHGAAVAGRSG